MDIQIFKERIFGIEDDLQFNDLAIQAFGYQYANNAIYRGFCDVRSIDFSSITHYTKIPFIPVEFFRDNRVVTGGGNDELEFVSSGTTGQGNSTHHVLDKELYEMSLLKGFERFLGSPQNYHILALLPSYLERENSSLVYMVRRLIELSNSRYSGFYLHNLKELQSRIKAIGEDDRKILLIGVSYALLELAEKYPLSRKNLLVMETGGMKGRRKELMREELHSILKGAFEVDAILSEYGMTELLSQAYSSANGVFATPPWMKVVLREMNDPLSIAAMGRTGIISIIDLANINSCSFVNTMDIGRMVDEKHFLVLGRMDYADARGCNLMIDG